jgi:malate dehydrogenase (oxaloacetate-decarboxylating)
MPILIDAADVDAFVESVVRIACGFGGIHLEDISAIRAQRRAEHLA